MVAAALGTDHGSSPSQGFESLRLSEIAVFFRVSFKLFTWIPCKLEVRSKGFRVRQDQAFLCVVFCTISGFS